jgi:cytochrome c-type biogenesis protein CcmH
MMMRRFLICLAAWLAVAGPALAVQPDEILSDPAKEARARAITSELRCMVCQNESIDDSNAPLAKDLRVLVRERIVAGDTDIQVKEFLLARYGEFVLLRPLFTWRNAVLWLAPFGILMIGAFVVFSKAREKRRPEVTPLSAAEKAELERVLSKKS